MTDREMFKFDHIGKGIDTINACTLHEYTRKKNIKKITIND